MAGKQYDTRLAAGAAASSLSHVGHTPSRAARVIQRAKWQDDYMLFHPEAEALAPGQIRISPCQVLKTESFHISRAIAATRPGSASCDIDSDPTEGSELNCS